MLDDFKTALDRLKQYSLHKIGGALSEIGPGDFVDTDQAREKKMELPPNGRASHLEARAPMNVQEDGEIDLESALRMDSAQIAQLRDLGEMEKG